MECVIEDSRLNVFSKSVRLMSKYTDFVCIRANSEVLTLQALNSSKSSFAEVVFQKDFFKEYCCSDDFECCVDTKSFLLVFRIINLGKFIV